MTDREFWLLIRQALLNFIEAIEVKFGIHPRTSEIRKLHK